jgi:predicted RNA-binding protein YlqC (UPF0109 family)
MEHTLITILKAITTHSDDVSVEVTELRPGIVEMLITANDEDKGVIIGKSGRTIKALSDIIAIKALKENKHAILKIV